MKNSIIKRFFAALCSMVMLLSVFVVNAGAASTFGGATDPTQGTITITKMDTGNINPVSGVQFDYVKIANAVHYEYSDGTNVTKSELVFDLTTDGQTIFGATITSDLPKDGEKQYYRATDIQNALTAIGRKDNGELNQDVAYTSNDTTDTTGKIVATVDLGVYLFNENLEASNPMIDGSAVTVSKAAGPFLVAVPQTANGTDWTYDVAVSPKNIIDSDGDGEKSIVSGGTEVRNDETGKDYVANIGDVITYKITSTIKPTTEHTRYSEYTITDTADKSLDYIAKDETVLVSGSQFIVEAKLGDTILEHGVDFVIVLTPTSSNNSFRFEMTQVGKDKLNAVTANTVLSITYKARLNGTAPATGTKNNAVIYYKHDTTAGGGDVPTVTVYTYDMTVTKVFETIANVTPDPTKVHFKLVDGEGNEIYAILNGTQYVVTKDTSATGATNLFACDATGKVLIHGLTNGEYKLSEIQTDEAYALLKSDVSVNINNANAALTIKNDKKNIFELPLTGGAGTWIYTVGGFALIGLAVLMIVGLCKKKTV